MSTWRIRHEGSPQAVDVPSAARVLEGIRDGDWEPSDEVRGPTDSAWQAIEDHPLFADAVADLEPPKTPEPDEARLDMNPLIDVALVLLIFYMITTSYANLRRVIDLPPEPPADAAKKHMPKLNDVKDRIIKVKMWMEGETVFVTLEGKPVSVDDLEKEIAEAVKSTGRKDLFADVSGDVPWGKEAKLYDAAKGAGILTIFWPKGK
jgi:biopolymer transport protein ExbD